MRNILERDALLADGDTADVAQLPGALDSGIRASDAVQPLIGQEILPLNEAERLYMRRALRQLCGDKPELSRRPGVSERTLYRKPSEKRDTGTSKAVDLFHLAK